MTAPVCFIAGGNMSNAGARLRAYWPARFIDDAVVVTWADTPPDGCAAYVFQKLVDLPLMKRLRAAGALCFWDVCDPSWWFNPADSREVLDYATAVVASNVGLAADLRQWSPGVPVHTIPDRLLLSHYNRQAHHAEREPVRLIWFGAAQNRMSLYAAHATLQRLAANGHAIALTICDNAPNAPFVDLEGVYPVYYTRWSVETEAATLAAHDVALLPPYPGPWGAVKSNNKPLTAWAAGLPVATGTEYDVLRALVTDVQLRRDEAAAGYRVLSAAYRVEQSAADWLSLVNCYAGATRPASMEAAYVVAR